MKKKLVIVLVTLLALLPSLVWWYDSHHHQLGLGDLQAEQSLYQHRLQVSLAAIPALFDETLYLISQTDSYLYEFDISNEPDLIVRYRIGPKQKHVMQQPDRIVMGFTVEGIRNFYGQVKVFTLSERRLETVIEDVPFLSNDSINMMVYNGWIYTWGWQEGQVLLSWTDGTQTEHHLLAPPDDSSEVVGFRYQPKLINYPVLEIGPTRAYELTPAGPAQMKPTDNFSERLGDEKRLHQLLEESKYDQLYLVQDYLLARHLINDDASGLQVFVSDVFVLPGLSPVGQINSEGFIYPVDLAVAGDYFFENQVAALEAQSKVVAHYEQQLARTEHAMAEYLAHQQARTFLFSPTSLSLIVIQFGWFYICLRAIKESGLRHGC